MFWIVVFVLLIISFLWALLSLKKELSTPEIRKTQEELMKEKILFIKD
jgi:hypothetical protein